MEKRFDPKKNEREKKQTNRKKWYKAVCSLAAVVVVCTVYTLMLPALTLDEDSAGDAGVTISESAVPTSESPAADNSTESTAADSSADSSPADTESGTAAAAPSDDSAPSNNNENEITTLPSTDRPAGGIVIGDSGSTDEATAPDAGTDNNGDTNNEENKDENTDSPAVDNDSSSDSGSSSDSSNEDASDPTADVEDASIWEATIPDLSNYTTWADKLVAVAQSQLGYKESILNFAVGTNGEHKGYTRYGAWMDNPYGDWCAMFVSFCLNYAGIEDNDSIIPYNANCQTWVENLTANKIFEDPDTYLPEPGDIVFFDQKGNGKADHVGIVSDVEYGTKTVKRHVVVGTETAVEDSAIALLTYANSLISEETPVEILEATETEVTVAKSITVIEGNSSDQVQTVTYDMTDDSIIGFASMLEAEYINDGGNIDDIKNTDQINQPVTLEDQIAVQKISGDDTVFVGKTTDLTGGNVNYGYGYNRHQACTSNDKWISDNEDIATVRGSGNTATVTGKSVGAVKITHTYCTENSSGYYHRHNSSGSEEITINVIEAPKPTSITITGANTVRIGANITLSTVFNPSGSNADVRWESSDTTKATVDDNGIVKGIKATDEGETVTITASFIDDNGRTISATHEITVNRTVSDNARFYYLKTPTSDPESNDTSQWGANTGTGTIDVNGATWTGDKNIFDSDIKVVDRVISWPSGLGTVNDDGSLTVSTTSPHWNIIFEAFKSSIKDENGNVIQDINKNDITAIILHPYKISKNNSTTPDKHVDCTVEIKSKLYVTATYNLWDAGKDGYEWLAAGNYRSNSGAETKYAQNYGLEFGSKGYVDLPPTKKVGNREYKFVGWYDNPELTGSPVEFPFEMFDENVNFYAKYVEIDYNVNYAIADGCAGYGKINGNIVKVTEDLSDKEVADGCTAVPNDGYIFDGWYTDATCKTKVPDSWVVDGKIVPEQNANGSWNDISGKTFYAKFIAGAELPETGGSGTTLIYLLGAMLITAPLTITFIKRRREKKRKTKLSILKHVLQNE